MINKVPLPCTPKARQQVRAPHSSLKCYSPVSTHLKEMLCAVLLTLVNGQHIQGGNEGFLQAVEACVCVFERERKREREREWESVRERKRERIQRMRQRRRERDNRGKLKHFMNTKVLISVGKAVFHVTPPVLSSPPNFHSKFHLKCHGQKDPVSAAKETYKRGR